MIDSLHTACKHCAFAKREGQRQVSCEFGQVENYRNAGAEIIEAFDDHGNEFFVINKRICPMKRTKEWAAQFAKSARKDIVMNQIKLPYHAMLILTREEDIPLLIEQAKVLAGQETPPSMLSIISTCVVDSIYKMNMEIAQPLNKIDGLEYRVQNTVDQDKTVRELIDLAADAMHFKTTSPYYVVFEVSKQIPLNFSTDFEKAIHIHGKQIIFAYPVDGLHGMIAHRQIHRKHTGNAFNVNLEDKIANFEENAEKFMFNSSDIFDFNG